MVRAAMIESKANGGGYVLDGMPRNMAQARALYEIAAGGEIVLHFLESGKNGLLVVGGSLVELRARNANARDTRTTIE